jgi:hypothetical protein
MGVRKKRMPMIFAGGLKNAPDWFCSARLVNFEVKYRSAMGTGENYDLDDYRRVTDSLASRIWL